MKSSHASARSGGVFDLPSQRARLATLEKKSQQDGFWGNPRAAGLVAKEVRGLKEQIGLWERFERELADLEATVDLLNESPDEELEREAGDRLTKLNQELADLEFRQMLSGDRDADGAILSINAGAGGTESCDWAEMLLRMYRMWADRHGYKNEVVDFTPGDQAGFRSVTLTVEGTYAYGYLKAEVGVHRLVRISPFDSNKRRHTSFASVFILPDIEEEIEVEIKESDLRIDTFRSSGAGGQHVNKTDSAVRLTHLPTNIVVACQNERSQHRNKATAMKILKARLFEREMEVKAKERAKIEEEKKEIAWGSQIRSYVLHPYRMVKDHRTDHEIGDTDRVLNGEIDDLIKTYLLKAR